MPEIYPLKLCYNRSMWIDCGCDDFDRARLNRDIISNKLYTWAYVKVENSLAGLAVFGELPYWMPQDSRNVRTNKGRRIFIIPADEDDPAWENVRKLKENK